MTFAVCYTNFGPYHLARLRALADLLARRGDRLLAYEIADREERYPWDRSRADEPFAWTTLFPGRAMETIPREACARAMTHTLDADRPDALGAVGYTRPESMAMLRWGLRHHRPAVLLSESQELDHPRTWWKEAIKRRRVRRFSSALAGGPRHRDYLAKLGLPADRVALGNNAVDNAAIAARADAARADPAGRGGLPEVRYFLAINRFAPEKNLVRLVRAFAAYRDEAPGDGAWELVLCGGGSEEAEVDAAIGDLGLSGRVHRPGFLQEVDLARWLAHASAFVHPSLMEPWGLVVNEAAACGLPLLVSDRAGCVETLVPDPSGTTGRRFNPRDEDDLAASLAWMAGLDDAERVAMGRRAASVVAEWGPERFALGAVEALELASKNAHRRTESCRS